MRISDWSSDVCSSDLSVAGIVDYVRRLGALVGAAEAANAYADELQRGLDDIAAEAARLPRRPRVYFEEWDEPPITGIRWGRAGAHRRRRRRVPRASAGRTGERRVGKECVSTGRSRVPP